MSTVMSVNAIEPLKQATNHEIIYVFIIRGRYLGVEETLRVVGLKGPRRVKLLSQGKIQLILRVDLFYFV